jgi:hypothetical protein
MLVSSPSTSAKNLLSSWERALLVLPALAGLGLGFLLVFLPGTFASLTQFPADDAYIYQLAGATIIGYGVALSLSVFQRAWLAVRLVVIGVLVNNLGSLYACAAELFTGHAPASVFLFLVTNLVFVAICILLLVRHTGGAHPAPDVASPAVQGFLVVGAVAAGVFGILPLFVPELFTVFNLHINAPFVVREAGAGSLGYAVVAVLAQRALSRLELPLIIVMAGIFNGVGGLVSIPYLVTGDIALLPWVIAPVGLIVFVVCVIAFRQVTSAAPASTTLSSGPAVH